MALAPRARKAREPRVMEHPDIDPVFRQRQGELPKIEMGRR